MRVRKSKKQESEGDYLLHRARVEREIEEERAFRELLNMKAANTPPAIHWSASSITAASAGAPFVEELPPIADPITMPVLPPANTREHNRLFNTLITHINWQREQIEQLKDRLDEMDE